MFYVRLARPLPGIEPTVFVFFTVNEASEFASCIAARFPEEPSAEVDAAGDATEVFEHWSF